MGCGGIQPRETDFVGRAWCGRGLRDRHPSTTRPTARSLPLGARATGRQGGASTPSRSHSPRTSSARLVDRTATGATRPWRRQRATASRPLAGPRPARTLTNSPRDTSSCTSDGPLISCRDRAPAAVTVAREPTAASSQPKGCAPTPCNAAPTCIAILLARTSSLRTSAGSWSTVMSSRPRIPYRIPLDIESHRCNYGPLRPAPGRRLAPDAQRVEWEDIDEQRVRRPDRPTEL